MLLVVLPVTAQGNDKLKIYSAYIHNNMTLWKHVIDSIQQHKKRSNEQLLTLVNYQYGYIGWCIGSNQTKDAERYIALVENNLELLEKNKYNLSMVYAYRAAISGFKIGLNKFKAPFLGPASIRYAENALKLNPENYFALLQMGNIQFYMPRVFGGSVDEAIAYFLKAKAVLEKNKAAIRQDWNYLNLLTIIAQAYSDTGDYNKAKYYYDMILEIEPNFQWIKDELYKELMQKLKN